MAKTPFKGTIKLDIRDSKADWTPYLPAKAPRRGAERPVRAVRRHGAGGLVALRRPDQHADVAEAGGSGPQVLAVAHDGALLAYPLHAPDRTQPPPERHGRHHRGRERIPRCERPHSAGVCHPPAATPGRRLEHVLAGQGPQRPRAGHRLGRDAQAMAAAAGLRSVLRLPGRRDQPVVSRPRRRQPVHRPAVQPRGGVPPLQGPGRPGAPDDPRPQGHQPVEAVVHVVLPRRQPCPAPLSPGLHRQVQGQVRRRLRGVPGNGASPHDREGYPAEGHPADPDQSAAGRCVERRGHGASVGHAQCRREEAVLPPHGGVRRILGVHRRAGRPHHRAPGEDRPAREHGRHLRRGQRRVRRGQPQRIGEREQVLQRLPRRAVREPEAVRPSRQPGHLRALPDRLGHGDLGAVQDVQALLGVCRRHLRPAGHLLAEGHQGARRGAQPVPSLHGHRADHPRYLRAGDAQGLPGRRAVSAVRRLDALLL